MIDIPCTLIDFCKYVYTTVVSEKISLNMEM